jgi:FixJ family two-component response regulator
MTDTVYIVDDDEAVRDSLRALLAAHGFAVDEFPSGSAFLDGHQSSMRGCVLLDVNLPGIDGFSVLRLLIAEGAGLPVIMMSARADGGTYAVALEAGPFGFVHKPFVPGQLIALITGALCHRR